VTSELPTPVRNRLRALARSTRIDYEVALRELLLKYGSVPQVVKVVQTDSPGVYQMLTELSKQNSQTSTSMRVS
jgi:hypothetical protein